MATTTNFGWETPDDTDLVKDGAAAIRTLGQSIDTSMADLEGGTTGQILAKNSNTDMDFIWIANDQGDITAVTAGTGISGGGTSGAVTVTNSMATEIDAKGDLVAGTGADTFARLGVGANNTVLTADSTAATGLKWAAPAAADKTFSLVSATALSGSTTTVTGITGDNIFILIIGASSSGGSTPLRMRFNTDTGANYGFGIGVYESATSYAAGNLQNQGEAPASNTYIQLGWFSNNAGSTYSGAAMVFGTNTAGIKPVLHSGSPNAAGGVNHSSAFGGGTYSGTSAITSVSVLITSGTFDAGTIYVYKG